MSSLDIQSGRDAPNEITIDQFAVADVIIWLHYKKITHEPEGAVCLICWTNFLVGGYRAVYKTLTKFKDVIDDPANAKLVREVEISRSEHHSMLLSCL